MGRIVQAGRERTLKRERLMLHRSNRGLRGHQTYARHAHACITALHRRSTSVLMATIVTITIITIIITFAGIALMCR